MHLPKQAGRIALSGVRLAGRSFDVRCTRTGGIDVDCGGRRYSAPLGGAVTLPPAKR